MNEGWCTLEWLITVVLILLSSDCPVQAIVHACPHGEQLHAESVVYSGLYLQQVHADEIDATCSTSVVWMAMIIMVPSRLWVGGGVVPRVIIA